jgi:replicative DNA helicase
MTELIDLAAERLVLAGMFSYGENIYLDIGDILRPGSFSDTSNQAIWKCFVHLYEKRDLKEFDQASVQAAASELGFKFLIDQPNEIRHLGSIFNTRVQENNVRIWAGKLRKLEIARLLKAQLEGAGKGLSELNGEEPIETILGIAEDAVFDFSTVLNNDESSGTTKLSDGFDSWIEHVKTNPVETVGISSGWSVYDQAIGGGFRRGTISLIGARPKVGKSMVALNIAINVAERGIPVLFLDTEMKNEDHWPRAIANLASRSEAPPTINEIEQGKFVNHNIKEKIIDESINKFYELPLHYRSVIGLTIEETLPLIRRWLHKEVGYDENGRVKDCLVIYDYIKLQSAGNLSDALKEYQILGFTMTTLHNFVGRFDIPMFALIQLNRDGQTQETGAAFSQSDRILWLVTNFSIFKAKTDEQTGDDSIDSGNRKIVPISARHGEGMQDGDYINMYFSNRHATIREGKTRNFIRQERLDAQREKDQLDGSA